MLNAKRIFHLLAILALSMHVMAQLSPLWATEGSGFDIQICSGDSFRTVTIDENGNEIPAKPKMRTQKCSFCAASNFTATPTNHTAIPRPAPCPTKISTEQQNSFPPISKSTRAHQTRAPPVLS